MTDVNPEASEAGPRESRPQPPQGRAGPDPRLVTLVELLYFAYRDFTGDADAVLAKFGFGRAHHRVLHFVSRNPGIRVADLLDILKITKQSLARVLKQLVDEDHIVQLAGVSDRRERQLHVTLKGSELARELMALQTGRVAEAMAALGPAAQASAERFLFGLIAPEERGGVLEFLRATGTARDSATRRELEDHNVHVDDAKRPPGTPASAR